MSQVRFEQLVGEIAEGIGTQPLNSDLTIFLNKNWPLGGAAFDELTKLCAQGEQDGWLMSRQAGNIKFGRAIKPGESAGRFSVDVVRMKDVKGPHHVHPEGEIGAIMQIEGDPKFDAFDTGWYVYPSGSAHNPTVSGGDAYVLYLLPNGAIEFTGK